MFLFFAVGNSKIQNNRVAERRQRSSIRLKKRRTPPPHSIWRSADVLESLNCISFSFASIVFVHQFASIRIFSLPILLSYSSHKIICLEYANTLFGIAVIKNYLIANDKGVLVIEHILDELFCVKPPAHGLLSCQFSVIGDKDTNYSGNKCYYLQKKIRKKLREE